MVKQSYLLIVLGTIALAFVTSVFLLPCGSLAPIMVGKSRFCIERALTPQAWATGLSGRDRLPQGHGMLFVFSERAPRTFWMRAVRFPLDMIWIRERHVVGFETRVAADGGERQIPTPAVDAVLEVNAGEVEQLGVHVGDTVHW